MKQRLLMSRQLTVKSIVSLFLVLLIIDGEGILNHGADATNVAKADDSVNSTSEDSYGFPEDKGRGRMSDGQKAPGNIHHPRAFVMEGSQQDEGLNQSRGETGGDSSEQLQRPKDVTESRTSVGVEADKEGLGTRLWGAGTQASSDTSTSSTANSSPPLEEVGASSQPKASESTSSTSQQYLPFVPTKIPSTGGGSGAANGGSSSAGGQVGPPEGFSISARVYLDPRDKMAHFDQNDLEQPPIALPYWDCGVSGTTTAPLPIRNAYFRHAMATTSTVWKLEEDDLSSSTSTGRKPSSDLLHPVLAVMLVPTTVELNSGVSKDFQAGEVVLLEDVMLPGHKMRAAEPHRDLQILFLTLPQQHLQPGKDNLSLRSTITQRVQDPCPDIRSTDSTFPAFGPDSSPLPPKTFLVENPPSSSHGLVRDSDRRQGSGYVVMNARQLRKMIFVAVGLSTSMLAADFLARVAPLWLAVGVGGTVFVAGSTYGITLLGDRFFTSFELWRQRRKLQYGNTGVRSIGYEGEDSSENNSAGEGKTSSA